AVAGLLRPDHRATVDLGRRLERDLARRGGRLDVVIAAELPARRRTVEDDLDLLPERIEPIALDRIEHTDELVPGRRAAIRLVDGVDAPIARERALLATGGQLGEVDGEHLAIIERRHLPAGPLRAR